ncbi:Cyclin-dependent kinase inhibitor rum1 [Schizosaccharomyces pombe]|uniref:Cyclin-dependent kinase inhibitor rum1 n=1 Tax=Schizosaccharomyces pombe (strain 972 / ATCC 24843) TaxID=284812 RepID=RUM1_SCHPO|nr:CDK inhibitor Rum1 [Schizosaccharomyces pombe]P40380.2 RecName: Full=Cyclin-dependent kinase inhibitor rum1; AltName: Full=p25-rum1 [Schizosaccharomyces pombe 972h-]CAA19370.1 CDK inhibitor Rum1 [Schizosaccharomyces pombe]|eukprot:NP_596152.1 CDK inhibitor Rum1 [Schizosaccharomyces pombe]
MEPSTPPMRGLCTPSTPESPGSFKGVIDASLEGNSSIMIDEIPESDLPAPQVSTFPPTPAKTPKKQLLPNLMLQDRSNSLERCMEEDREHNPFLSSSDNQLLSRKKRKPTPPPSDGLYYVFRGKRIKKSFRPGTDLSTFKPKLLFADSAPSSSSDNPTSSVDLNDYSQIGILPPNLNSIGNKMFSLKSRVPSSSSGSFVAPPPQMRLPAYSSPQKSRSNTKDENRHNLLR